MNERREHSFKFNQVLNELKYEHFRATTGWIYNKIGKLFYEDDEDYDFAKSGIYGTVFISYLDHKYYYKYHIHAEIIRKHDWPLISDRIEFYDF